MAITIKSIPILESKAAKQFTQKAEAAFKNKASINFSKQVNITASILSKAKLK
jgi:hypothetical protein